MGRWEPDARGGLAQAAFALYAERGFDNTSVAEIAERAGLSEPIFFRHFADKREVQFARARELQDLLVRTVADLPGSVAPIDAVAAGVEAAVAQLQRGREQVRQRQSIIMGNAELRERELIKLASLRAAIADTLCHRGVNEPDATLTAEVGIATFSIAFDRWIREDDWQDFPQLVRDSVDRL